MVRYLVILLASTVAVRATSAERVDFNVQVRPILNAHCVACHGGVKQAGDLSFVYQDQALGVVEPGEPESSPLYLRVSAEDPDERMPPAEHGPPLRSEEIEILQRWIEQGASWGDHWSFVPPQTSEIPADRDDTWSRGPIDRFVLRRLKLAKLTPAPAAAPERWLRRVTLDLTGLPPTLEERAAFLADLPQRGDEAFDSVVERLLASPQFGERWGSVWLDVMRYADSRGLGQDRPRSIWKYRDWVIRALNDDLPFDQFTLKQLAGDLLPEPTIDDLVATASNRLTQTNEEGGTDDEQFRVEAVLDRVNTVWQAWQGLSFGCVQCHSHPYDPIRHEEYYRFLAFFNNTVDCDLPKDQPNLAVPLDAAQAEAALHLDRQIEQLWFSEWQAAQDIVRDESQWAALTEMQASTNTETKVEVVEHEGIEEFRTVGTVAKRTTIRVDATPPGSLEQLTAIRITGLPVDEQQALKDSEWGFVLSHVAAELVAADGGVRPLELVFVLADEQNPLLDPQQSLNGKSEEGWGTYSRIHYPRSAVFLLAEAVELEVGDRLRVALRHNILETGAYPLTTKRGRIAVTYSRDLARWWQASDRKTARSELAELRKQRQAIPAVATPIMAERMSQFARPTYVFDRGGYLSKTELVSAATPEFFPSRVEAIDTAKTRLDLARWIASAENPLTARVAVNRIWSQFFGTGLVETQEDFGSSGSPPTHPELLDDLAARFQGEMRWSMKALIREIALSSTYRQSSQVTAAKQAADPRNRLLSRGPHNRLPAETIRDQALALGGLLSLEQFGPPVHPPIPAGVWTPFEAGDKWKTPAVGDPNRYRRTIYTYAKRSIPFPIMASFDAPSREFCSVRRLPSNTPLQALATLNDTNFVEAAQGLALRMSAVDEALEKQLAYGFLLATCRELGEEELASLRQLYERTLPGGQDDAMQAVATVLLNLDEVLTQ